MLPAAGHPAAARWPSRARRVSASAPVPDCMHLWLKGVLRTRYCRWCFNTYRTRRRTRVGRTATSVLSRALALILPGAPFWHVSTISVRRSGTVLDRAACTDGFHPYYDSVGSAPGVGCLRKNASRKSLRRSAVPFVPKGRSKRIRGPRGLRGDRGAAVRTESQTRHNTEVEEWSQVITGRGEHQHCTSTRDTKCSEFLPP